MDKALVEELHRQYPDLMAQGGQEPSAFSEFGIEAGSGWYPIIYELFGLLDDARKTTGKPVKISQLKEKFGCLRFYGKAPMASEELALISQLASAWSSEVCDVCGEVGKARIDGGYRRVRCDRHAANKEYLRDSAAAVKALLTYQRKGLPAKFKAHIAATSATDDLVDLTITHLPDLIVTMGKKSLSEQTRVTQHRSKTHDEARAILQAMERNDEAYMLENSARGFM